MNDTGSHIKDHMNLKANDTNLSKVDKTLQSTDELYKTAFLFGFKRLLKTGAELKSLFNMAGTVTLRENCTKRREPAWYHVLSIIYAFVMSSNTQLSVHFIEVLSLGIALQCDHQLILIH